MSESFELWDYRRRVHAIYSRVRSGNAGEVTWHRWVADRDDLFGSHPQSDFEDRSSFSGLTYFDYDPGWRTIGRFSPVDDEEQILAHSGEGSTTFRKIGGVRFETMGHPGYLDVLWLDAYGGGVFLPFRDATNGDSTYGGGRYLLDTVKGADLGHEGDEMVLDFNFAYHPSCVHSDRWSCPLPPAANTLGFAVVAGERLGEAPSNP